MSKYYSSSIAFGANQTKPEKVVVSPTKIGDVTTDAVSGALTVDEVPTLDSLNPVSSDGVARAVIQAGAELPTRGSSDTGKVLTVANSDGDLEWDEPADGLPDMAGQDGKLLGAVDNNGTMEAQWVNPPESYPSVAGNANKVLTVNSGATGVEWANTQLPEEKSLASTNNTISITEGATTVSIDVTNPLPATLGTAGQVLAVNSGATGVEWTNASGGGDIVVIPLTAAPTGVALETLFNQVDTAVSADKQVVIKTTNSGNKVRYFALTNTNPMSQYGKFYHFNCIEMAENMQMSIDAIDHWMVVSYTNFGSDPQYNFTVSDFTIASNLTSSSFDPFSA